MAQHKSAAKTRGKGRSSTKSLKKAAASRRTKPGSTKREYDGSVESAVDAEVTIDRRRANRRGDDDTPPVNAPQASTPAPQLERREKVNRRRQIDPTTCERDYTDDEVEFMNALDEYKRKSGRMFPTCSEVLEVIRSLGYAKGGKSQAISCSAEPFVVPVNAAETMVIPASEEIF